MADVTVYAFNNGYELASGLHSIITFMGGPEWAGFVYLGACLAVVITAWGAKAGDFFIFLKGLVFPLLIYYAILAPKANVNIVDDFNGQFYNVDNVPIGIGVSLQLTSNFEKIMREMADNYLQPVNAPKFKDWDFMGHVRALDVLLQKEISLNQSLYNTIAEYFQNCVLHAMGNGLITSTSLINSPDLLSSIYVPYTLYLSKIFKPDGSEIIDTCVNVYNYIQGEVSSESGSLSDSSPMANIRRAIDKKALKNITDIRLAFDNLLNTIFPSYQNTAQRAFEQMFIINGIKTNLATYNPELLAYWSQASADQKQQSVISAMSYLESLNHFVPMMKLLVIFLFPFVGVFFITLEGKPFVYWFTSLCFVTLWSPTEAVVHAVTNHFLLDELMSYNAYNGITYQTHLNMGATLLDYVGPATMLAMAIPGLASLMLGWIAPKAMAVVAGPLLLGTNRFAMLAQRTGGESQRETPELARLQQEKELQESWGMASKQFQYWSQSAIAASSMMASYFGDTPNADNPFGGGTIRRDGTHIQGLSLVGLSKETMGETVKEAQEKTDTMAQKVAESTVEAMSRAKTEQERHSIVKNLMQSESFKEVLENSKVLSAAYNKAAQETEGWEQMTTEQKAKFFGAELNGLLSLIGGGKTGLNLGLGVSGPSGYKNSMNENDTIKSAKNYIENYTQNKSETDSKKIGEEISKVKNLLNSSSKDESVSFQTALNKQSLALRELNNVYKLSNSISRQFSSQAEAGINYSINTKDIISRLSYGQLLTLGRTIGDIDAFNNFKQAVEEGDFSKMQTALDRDLLVAVSSGKYEDLKYFFNKLDDLPVKDNVLERNIEIGKNIIDQHIAFEQIKSGQFNELKTEIDNAFANNNLNRPIENNFNLNPINELKTEIDNAFANNNLNRPIENNFNLNPTPNTNFNLGSFVNKTASFDSNFANFQTPNIENGNLSSVKEDLDMIKEKLKEKYDNFAEEHPYFKSKEDDIDLW